jgi:putative endonuclease
VRNGCRAVESATNESGLYVNLAVAERKRMKYVYILQSEIEPDKYYTGSTTDLKRRYKEHNDGKSIHTNKYRPWKLKMYFAFSDEQKADNFEAFLKTGNGRIFAKKHF